MSKFVQARFLIFSLVFVSRDFEVGKTSVAKSRLSGLIYQSDAFPVTQSRASKHYIHK